MNVCHSCKNKLSTDRCPVKSMPGLKFCKRHAKIANPRLWEVVNSVCDRVILIQKMWRGFAVRNYFKLAGEGVLNRKECHNEEDLITCVAKDKQHPLDYFSFRENGKLWWFDVSSLYEWTLQKLSIQNPYTQQPIDIEIRKRLREFCILRNYRKFKLLQSAKEYSHAEITAEKWMTICQQLEENLFSEVNPLHFLTLSQASLWIFTDMLRVDLQVWAAEHKDKPNSIRIKHCWMIRRALKYQLIERNNHPYCLYHLSCILSKILRGYKEPYPVCFMIMSALCRL